MTFLANAALVNFILLALRPTSRKIQETFLCNNFELPGKRSFLVGGVVFIVSKPSMNPLRRFCLRCRILRQLAVIW